MKSRAILFIFFILPMFFSLPSVFAQNLAELIGGGSAGALLSGERPISVQFDGNQPLLIPQNGVLKKLVETSRRDLNPSVMVETLYIYKKPPNAEKDVWSAKEEANLYNSALAISTLAGLEYYSASRGTMRTFYETSAVIDSPSAKKPVSDPVFTRPPEKLTIYAQQKDLSFGNNIYQYDYYLIPGGIIFIQQNLTSLSYGIIPAVGKNKLHSAVAVLDAENYLLVYMASMAKAASIPGMKERIGNSFANRSDAIFHWFSDQADKAFANNQ